MMEMYGFVLGCAVGWACGYVVCCFWCSFETQDKKDLEAKLNFVLDESNERGTQLVAVRKQTEKLLEMLK